MWNTELQRHIALLKRLEVQAAPQLSLFEGPISSRDLPAIQDLRNWVETEVNLAAEGGAQFVGVEDALRLFSAQPRRHDYSMERGSEVGRMLANEALLRFVSSIILDAEVRVPRDLFRSVSPSEATRIVSTHLALHLASLVDDTNPNRRLDLEGSRISFATLVVCVIRGECDASSGTVSIDPAAVYGAFEAPPGTVEYDFAVEFLLSPVGDYGHPFPSDELIVEALQRAALRRLSLADFLPNWVLQYFEQLVSLPSPRGITEGMKLMIAMLNDAPAAFDPILADVDWAKVSDDLVEWLIEQTDPGAWSDADNAGIFALYIAGLRCCKSTVMSTMLAASKDTANEFFDHALASGASDHFESYVEAQFSRMAVAIESGMLALRDDSPWSRAVDWAWQICEARGLTEVETLIQLDDWLANATIWSSGVEDSGWSSIADLAQRIENCTCDIGRSLTADERERLSGCVGDFCVNKGLISFADDEEDDDAVD